MNRLGLTLFPLLAASVLACGSLATDDEPVLATVHGQLTNPQSLQTPADTRVAVVWLGFAHGYSLAEDLPVQPVFPSQFLLDLKNVPPAAAMVNKKNLEQNDGNATPPGPGPDAPSGPTPTPAPAGGSSGGAARTASLHTADDVSSWSDDFSFAIGSVVAYQDLNHDGKLDLVDDGATAYVDRILGANESMILVYVEGTPPKDLADEAGHLPSPGYNLFQIPSCSVAEATTARETTGGSGSAASGAQDPAQSEPACAKSAWLPMSTLYTLPLTGDPKFSSIMCKSGGGFAGSVGGGSATSDTANGGAVPPSVGSDGGMAPDDAGLVDADSDGGAAPDGSTSDGGAADAGTDAAVPPDPSLPSPDDPKLQCSPDGKSFTYDCQATQPHLCGDTVEIACAARPMPEPTPPNWPCPVN